MRSIDVVTSEGEFHPITPRTDPRQFCALCGSDAGEIEHGVITAMTFTLFR